LLTWEDQRININIQGRGDREKKKGREGGGGATSLLVMILPSLQALVRGKGIQKMAYFRGKGGEGLSKLIITGLFMGKGYTKMAHFRNEGREETLETVNYMVFFWLNGGGLGFAISFLNLCVCV
jgi:hypothetical protein